MTGLVELRRAYDDPDSVAAGSALPVVRTLGIDVPRELLVAAGVHPIRLTPSRRAETPLADGVMGTAAMDARGKRLVERLLDPAMPAAPLLITQADQTQPQIFSALRELRRLGERVPADVHFLDQLHIDRLSSREYNRHRIAQLIAWLEGLTGKRVSDESVAAVAPIHARQAAGFDRLAALRRAGKVSGCDSLAMVGAASVLMPERHCALLDAALNAADGAPALDGKRVIVAGTAHETDAHYAAIEATGALIVGEVHGWGARFQRPLSAATVDTFAQPGNRAVPRATSPAAEAELVASLARDLDAEVIIHLTLGGDEAAPWDVASIASDRRLIVLRTGLDPDERFREAIGRGLAGEAAAPRTRATTSRATVSPGRRSPGQRSRKSLASVASFSEYQRTWFASVRDQVARGAPFAMVNANAPQEILRALGIPFVVNQWWASIVAAKQQSARYLALLADRKLPTNVEAYSAQGLAAAFDDDAAERPWGGLPLPNFVHAVASSDPALKIFDHWADATGARCFVYERTVDPRAEIGTRWWDDLPDRWDEVLEPERIDLMVAELRTVVGEIEKATGRKFDEARFREVMELVNEQEGYYRLTRDLIAATVPAPIGVVDQMPATMVPQWHRGTVWARDAAKAFYDEVKARVDAGVAAVPNERVRLMWVGRGLWSDMGFYQQWEESHGAIFIWSMYLALAADGYIRHFHRGRDPMRALAARFLTMGDELRMPTWAGPWHVHEAVTHRIDAAVALSDADPFVVRALRAAGIPVLELTADNFARDPAEGAAMAQAITTFIEGPATARATARREVAHARA